MYVVSKKEERLVMSRRTHIVLALVVSLYLALGTGLAQVKSSSITGVVTDASGGVVPNASVVVTNEDTNISTEVKTSLSGDYTAPYLPAGRYTVTVRATGFQTWRKTGIVMGTATTIRADALLAAGNVSTSIEVKADAAVLQTESSTVQQAVSQRTIATIPNINNNPLYYATLEAGVIPSAQMYTGSNLGVGYSGRQSMSAIRINGGMLGGGDVQLDGLSIQGAAWHEATILPDRDALQEVRVITNTFAADLGNGQGLISLTTKSGTNQFHGSMHYRMRNEALNANGLYNNSHSIRRSKYRLSEGGGTIGGPVIIPKVFNGKDKLFFFASFSRLSHSDPVEYLAKVPTELERKGDFSQTKVADNNGAAAAVQIFNPFTATPYQGSSTVFQRQAYPNAVITNANRYGLKMLQAYPLPNRTPSDAYNANNYHYSGSTPVYRNNLAARLDYRLGNRHSLYTSGGLEKASSTPPNRWGDSIFVNMASPGVITDDNPYFSLGDTVTVSPTTVLDVRYGLTRINTQASYPSGTGFDYSAWGMPASVQSLVAVPGAPTTIGNFAGSGNRAGYGYLNDDTWTRKKEAQLNHALTGSLTHMHGKWTFKFGGEYRVYLGNWQDLLYGTPSLGVRTATNTGTAEFVDAYGAYSSMNSNPLRRGLDAATALTGTIGYNLTAGTSAKLALAAKYAAFYTQNDWKATSRLTINLGLRYEVQPGPTERYNRGSSVDLTRVNPYAPASLAGGSSLASLGMIVFPGTEGYARNLWNTQWKDISPRIGIAYRLGDSTVIRGGYGRVFVPSNTGFNANGLIYGPGSFAGGADTNAYGTTTQDGLPIGTFDQEQSTIIYPANGAVQSPALYGNPNAAMGVDLFLRDGYQNGVMDQWNVFIQRNLGKSWLISAGYVGSRGVNLPWRGYQLNGTWSVPDSTLQAWRSGWLSSNALQNPAAATMANPFSSLVGKANGNIGKSTITNLVSQQPYLGLLGQTVLASTASSEYNALQLRLEHTGSRGLHLMANYTWSKAMGINGGATGSSYAESQMRRSLAPTGGADYRNLGNNHAVLNYDTPHRFVGVVSYLLPTGKGKALDARNPVARALIGDWEFGSVVTLQSGTPWGPSCSGTMNGRCNLNSGVSAELPEQLQGWYDGKTQVTLPSGRVITPSAYTYLKWNPDLFSQPVVQLPNGNWQVDQYQWGSTATTLDWLRTPLFANVNLTITRRFNLRERAQLEFMAETTNLFNRTNFTSNAVNGAVTSVLSANSATKTAVGQNANVAFGSLSMAFMDPRQVILSLRLRF